MTPRKVKVDQRIARALMDVDLDELRTVIRKTEAILLRVSPVEKEEIRIVAEALELSVSEYLLMLHRAVRERVQ